MADVATMAPEQGQASTVQTEQQPIQPDINQQLANSLWGDNVISSQPAPSPAQSAVQEQPPITAPAEEIETISVEDYFQREFGIAPAAAKVEWESLRKLKEAPPAPPPVEPQFANDESKRVYEAIAKGNTKEVYEYLHRQSELEQAANLSGAEAIKLHIKLNNPHYKPEDIADVFEEKYTFPPKPMQDEDESEEIFQAKMNQYNQSVEKINRRIERDSFAAKEGLSQLKSQLVFPEIQQAQSQQQQPDQKELEARNAAVRQEFLQDLASSYQNFKGFSVTAKDGEVQLPVNYTISPEELSASKEMLETFNHNQFFENRWLINGKPNVAQMQEDLYLLQNKDKIFQKIANESAAQRFVHHQKIQNNINLNGVNNQIAPPQQQIKSESETAAENIWKL